MKTINNSYLTPKMTVKETLRLLEKSENYILERSKISDEFIEMVKTMLPYDYERIADKEKNYLEVLSILHHSINV